MRNRTNRTNRKRNKLLVISYLLLVVFYSIFSYAFLDPNLTLTSFGPYLKMQKTIREWGMYNKPQSTVVFIVLSSLLFTVYAGLCRASSTLRRDYLLKIALLIGLIMLFSYPAFSHDIFNYIFNAKMVLQYGGNPHTRSAIEFADPMLGFMRNVHTPAPYFYGWTAISLLPYFLGLGRIFTEIIAFKIFSVVFLFLGYLTLKKIYSIYKVNDDKLRLTLFLLNPLILIEAIGVGHNDLTMMVSALASFYFLIKFKKSKNIKYFLLSVFGLLFSISNKYATIILLPLLIVWYYKPKFDIGTWGALLLFLLPFTRPLDQLHSWYLVWPLVWVLLSKRLKVVKLFYFISFTALLRYAPFVYWGNWSPPVPVQRFVIYFAPLILILPIMLYNLVNEKNK